MRVLSLSLLTWKSKDFSLVSEKLPCPIKTLGARLWQNIFLRRQLGVHWLIKHHSKECYNSYALVYHFTANLVITIRTSEYFLHSMLYVLISPFRPLYNFLESCSITIVLKRMTWKKLRDRKNRKFFTRFPNMANCFTGNRDPTSPKSNQINIFPKKTLQGLQI